jgi:hypothetical protein
MRAEDLVATGADIAQSQLPPWVGRLSAPAWRCHLLAGTASQLLFPSLHGNYEMTEIGAVSMPNMHFRASQADSEAKGCAQGTWKTGPYRV